jgi:hypothetical protein
MAGAVGVPEGKGIASRCLIRTSIAGTFLANAFATSRIICSLLDCSQFAGMRR